MRVQNPGELGGQTLVGPALGGILVFGWIGPIGHGVEELQALPIGANIHRAPARHAHGRPDPDRVVEAVAAHVIAVGCEGHDPVIHGAAPIACGLAHGPAVHGNAVAEPVPADIIKERFCGGVGRVHSQAHLQVPLHIAGPAFSRVVLQVANQAQESHPGSWGVPVAGFARKGTAPHHECFSLIGLGVMTRAALSNTRAGTQHRAKKHQGHGGALQEMAQHT